MKSQLIPIDDPPVSVVSSVMPRGDAFQLQGLDGGIVLQAGDSIQLSEGKSFRWLQIVTDTVLDSFGAPLSVGSRLEDPDKLCGPLVLPAGLGIGGEFQTIVVTSGTCIAYKL